MKRRTTMKTKEELNALKNEVEALNKKLAELTEEELAQVTGGGVESYLDRSQPNFEEWRQSNPETQD